MTAPLNSLTAFPRWRPQLASVAKSSMFVAFLFFLLKESTWSFTASETEMGLLKKVMDFLCSRIMLLMFSLNTFVRALENVMVQDFFVCDCCDLFVSASLVGEKP